jgi:starch-binding outer membrane protein, SusD/RagB family
MKTKLIPCLFIIFLMFSCSEFLQEDLQGEYSSATFYKTKEHAILAINGAYNILSFTNTNNCLWVFGDVASDDAIKGGGDGDQSEIVYIDQFNINASNSKLENIWQHYYEGISRANNVLYYVPDIAMDEVLKSRILGEAKFIRAFLYFNLVNIFGEIPLKLHPPLTSDEIYLPVSQIDAIYSQIEKDLTESVQVLGERYSLADQGRATKGAAMGLLAKAYLYQGKFTEALTAIDSIDHLGIYTLMQVYRNNFEAASQNNAESLFEIQHIRGQDPGLGNPLNQYFAPKGTGIYANGYGFDAPVQNFADEFEVTPGGVVDPRLDYSIGRSGKDWVNGEPFNPTWSKTGYLSKKHIQPFSEVPNAPADGFLSYIYLRYADILLMKAEALNELGRTPEALIPLNKVRKRSRESYLFDTSLVGYGSIPDNLLPDVTSADQQIVRTAIRHERRVELGLEFHRFFDLMRYGKQAAESALTPANPLFTFEMNRYFPIPLRESDRNPNI